jgi:hypothetical protein
MNSVLWYDQADSRWLFTAETWVEFQVPSRDIHGERGATGLGFSLSSLAFPC